MRINIVKSVLKKEIIDILRDKKTLFMTVMLPIVLYPIMFLLMGVIVGSTAKSMEEKALNIAFGTQPSEAIIREIEAYGQENGKLNIVATDDYKKDINEGRIDAYIESKTEGDTTHYTIYINSSKSDGSEASNRFEEVIEACKHNEMVKRIKDNGLEEQYILEPIAYSVEDIAENEQVMGSILGNVLPFVLIMGILLGAIYPSIDSMAGEKERGTLETLFTLPISNLELVMGKYLAVSLCALVSALLNILSVIFSIGLMIMSMGEMEIFDNMQFDMGKMVLPLLISIICMGLFALVISALSMCVCSLTKSFKEAQNAVTPLMLVAMLLSYSCMIPNLKLTILTASIPVVNVALLIKSVLTFNYNMGLITIVLASNIAFVMIAIWLLAKLFNSEEILFGSGKGFSFLEKRSNLKKGTLPTVSDGFIMYAFVMLVFLYICSYLQVRYKMIGLVLTELIIASIPILLSIYIKTDFKKVYSLNRLKITGIIGAICLWIGTYMITTLISNILVQWFPDGLEELAKAQYELMKENSLWVNLLVIAVLPAICEETLFRGFLLSAFTNGKHPARGILLTGILFGIMHVSLIKFLPITILGIAIAYAVYKTKSIFAGMLIHFLNNGFAVVATTKLTQSSAEIVQTQQYGSSMVWVELGVVIIATLIIFFGVRLVSYKN